MSFLAVILLAAAASGQTGEGGGMPAYPSISGSEKPASDSVLLPSVIPLGPSVFPPLAPVHAAIPKLIFQGSQATPEGEKIPPRHDVLRIGERNVGSGLDFYSLQREIALGRHMADEVERSTQLIDDPLVNEYVNRVAQNLVRNSDARVPFTVKIINEGEVNAFALPGGFFFVNSGLISAAQSEAELAGVMAHEIAHVAARHATRNATKTQLFNMLSFPMIFVGGPAGYALRQAVGLALPMSMLKFSRDAEREADLFGLQYQYAAGYDPGEFIRFFERLKLEDNGKSRSFISKAFRTHPMTGERVGKAQREIARYFPARDQHIVNTSEFDAMKVRLMGIIDRERIDEGKGVRPVLRRRGDKGSEKESGERTGPVLRRPAD
ncbi:MAG TPA: M48 family metallopeptidase [Terriglobales bacterium]|nr:M48 family metallopeptidase [Terriglobales bacterium]